MLEEKEEFVCSIITIETFFLFKIENNPAFTKGEGLNCLSLNCYFNFLLPLIAIIFGVRPKFSYFFIFREKLLKPLAHYFCSPGIFLNEIDSFGRNDTMFFPEKAKAQL